MKWVDNFEKSMGYTAVVRHGYIDENGNFSSFAVVVRKDELDEKLSKSKDGMIYLYDTDIKTIIEAVKEDNEGTATSKQQAVVGANLDLQA